MRKGQQKLLNKARKYDFIPQAIDLLADESKSLNELNIMWDRLSAFRLCQKEYIDDIDIADHIFEICKGWYISNDWNRTKEMANFIFKSAHIFGITERLILKRLAEAKASNNLNYRFGWDDIENIIDIVVANRDPSYEFNAYEPDTSEAVFLNYIIDEQKDLPAERIIVLFCIWIQINQNENIKPESFIRRVETYEKMKLSEDIIIEYENKIANGFYEDVCLDILKESYPNIRTFINNLKEASIDGLHLLNGSANDTGNCDYIYLFDTEEFKYYMNFMRSVVTNNNSKSLHTTDENSYFPLFMDISMHGLRIRWSLSLTGISLEITSFSKCHFFRNHNSSNDINIQARFEVHNDSLNYLFTCNYHIFKKTKTRWVPALFKDISDLYIKYENSRDILNFFLEQFIESGKLAWKDMIPYLTKCESHTTFPNITANEISDAHSFNEAVRAHYKRASFVNWNRCDARIGKLIMDGLLKVDDKSKNVLFSMKYMKESEFYNIHNYQKRTEYMNDEIASLNHIDIKKFLTLIILDKLILDSEISPNEDLAMYQHIMDYINTSVDMKHKISLTYRSYKKILQAHDKLNEEYMIQHTPKIIIPKDTKFKSLRKVLPDNFEWIKTRKRLVKEARIMHHCVATYADKINHDQCAIYSFVSARTNERYTVEFCFRCQKYYIRQIYGKFDVLPPREEREYVKSFL